jgi:acetylornithine deacetylase/succinyl-diaminopimelate desuccinylase-like protein
MHGATTIAEACADPVFRAELVDFLMAICAVDTTPNANVGVMREREAEVFALIRNYLGDGPWRVEERPIDPRMADHPAFSKLHFTKTAERPEGLSPAETYAGRGNLLVYLDGEPDAAGRDTAVNAHVDVIAPYVPPVREGAIIRGRGTIDDKGHVAAICGALKILAGRVAGGELTLKNRVTAMFVVEEETGGNGSLALALDRELKRRYASILVMESAGNRVYPGNRGAVWFRAEAVRATDAPVSLPEAVAFGALAMQREGAAIKAESEHPLFPHRPVQTCNGILGPYGEHPSRINGRIPFEVTGPLPALREALGRAVERYCREVGDKTTVADPESGRPKVARHYDATPTADGLDIVVYGSSGHMGSILENDDAILKWAYCVRELVALRKAGVPLRIALAACDTSRRLVLEGGQGFLPTHPIEEIEDRMRAAFARGVAAYLADQGAPSNAVTCTTTYDKLHNAAFAGAPDSPTMRNARDAAVASGMMAPDAPIRGWDVSCDARLFAAEYPDMPVVTGGVGALQDAHSDHEHIREEDLSAAVVFCADYLVRETASSARTGPIRSRVPGGSTGKGRGARAWPRTAPPA